MQQNVYSKLCYKKHTICNYKFNVFGLKKSWCKCSKNDNPRVSRDLSHGDVYIMAAMQSAVEDLKDEKVPACLYWTVEQVSDWIEELGFPNYKVSKLM